MIKQVSKTGVNGAVDIFYNSNRDRVFSTIASKKTMTISEMEQEFDGFIEIVPLNKELGIGAPDEPLFPIESMKLLGVKKAELDSIACSGNLCIMKVDNGELLGITYDNKHLDLKVESSVMLGQGRAIFRVDIPYEDFKAGVLSVNNGQYFSGKAHYYTEDTYTGKAMKPTNSGVSSHRDTRLPGKNIGYSKSGPVYRDGKFLFRQNKTAVRFDGPDPVQYSSAGSFSSIVDANGGLKLSPVVFGWSWDRELASSVQVDLPTRVKKALCCRYGWENIDRAYALTEQGEVIAVDFDPSVYSDNFKPPF